MSEPPAHVLPPGFSTLPLRRRSRPALPDDLWDRIHDWLPRPGALCRTSRALYARLRWRRVACTLTPGRYLVTALRWTTSLSVRVEPGVDVDVRRLPDAVGARLRSLDVTAGVGADWLGNGATDAETLLRALVGALERAPGLRRLALSIDDPSGCWLRTLEHWPVGLQVVELRRLRALAPFLPVPRLHAARSLLRGRPGPRSGAPAGRRTSA